MRDLQDYTERLVRAAIRRVDGPGHQQCELRRVPAVQRQFHQALLFHHLCDGRGRRIYLRVAARHIDGLRGHAQFQLHIYRERLVRQQRNSLFCHAKPSRLNADGILCRPE